MANKLVNELSDLRRALKNDPEGVTTREIMVSLGMPHSWVRQRLLELFSQGKIIVTQKQVKRIDGILSTVSAYKFKEINTHPRSVGSSRPRSPK